MPWLIGGFIRRPGALTPAQKTFGKTAEKHATSNASDVSRGESEELTALRAIVEAASHSSGEEYFQAFVRNLARLVDARYAFIAEFASPETTTKARTIAFWARDHIADN